MTKLTDKILAEQMLQARAAGGYRVLPFLRMNAKRYALLVVCFAAVLAFFAFAEAPICFAAIVGMVVGTFLRDISWLIGVQQNWPFVMKVTDWDRVNRVADGEPLA
jgi:hypothetical protein